MRRKKRVFTSVSVDIKNDNEDGPQTEPKGATELCFFIFFVKLNITKDLKKLPWLVKVNLTDMGTKQ